MHYGGTDLQEQVPFGSALLAYLPHLQSLAWHEQLQTGRQGRSQDRSGDAIPAATVAVVLAAVGVDGDLGGLQNPGQHTLTSRAVKCYSQSTS